jgi:hypothetical protein
MLKFFQIEGRFPRHPGELPSVAVDFVARQLGVPAAGFEVTGRAVERFRAPIRDVLGFRVFSRGDEDKMISWLCGGPSELNEDRQREAVLARCRGGEDRTEISGEDRMGLAAQEAGPGLAVPLGCGLDPVALEDLPDRRRGDLDARCGQLAVDPSVAPAGILLRQAQDEDLDAAKAPRGKRDVPGRPH